MADRLWVVALVVCGGLITAQSAEGKIDGTVHNLSATGPGNIKEPGVEQICIFCHTPHNANPSRPVWNHALPGVTYKLYASTTLEATLNQPTGASRLCLSCHDGTLALGNLRVPPSTGAVTLGPLTGRQSLGADLSDDHPVSFVYDSSLAIVHGELVDPLQLPKGVRVDATQQLQCTSCHNPHKDEHRKFLVTDERFGALCLACHRPTNWAGSSHAASNATWRGTGVNPWPNSPYSTVAENACLSCHWSHAAPRPPRLMSNAREKDVCLVCHNGAVASKNLEAEFLKFSRHPVTSTEWVHEPGEEPATMPRHVACADCHNPHQVVATTASPPELSGRLRGVPGVNISGTSLSEATYEYEVCLKCHGIKDQTGPGIVRQDNTRNVRLEINPSNPSYHPVASVGKHPTIQGLESGYTASSLIGCTDCHNNDEWTKTGTQPNGPHGSRFDPILVREYQQDNSGSKSPHGFALCYQCHNRQALQGKRGFPHASHIARASCAACHDAHGSRQHVRLINFMLRDRNGSVVVSPNQNGLIQFISTGPGNGECSLRCHKKEHNRREY